METTGAQVSGIKIAIRELMDGSLPSSSAIVQLTYAELRDIIQTAAVAGGEFVIGMIPNPGDPSDLEAMQFSLKRGSILPPKSANAVFSRDQVREAYEKGWSDATRNITQRLFNSDAIDDHLHLCRAVAQATGNRT